MASSNASPIRDLIAASRMSQRAFAEYFGIPQRTVENWAAGSRSCPQYLAELIEYKLKKEGIIK